MIIKSSFISVAFYLLVLFNITNVIYANKKAPKTTSTKKPLKISNGPSENYATIHYMDIKRSELIEQLPEVKESVADLLSSYCNQESNHCGLLKVNFSSEDIGFLGKTDKEKFVDEGRFVVAKLYAKIPSNHAEFGRANSEQIAPVKADSGEEEEEPADNSAVLSSKVLDDFLTENRNEIVNNSKVEIAFVNNKLVYPPRDNTDNYILVSISCAFCIFLIVFNFVCQKKREKELKNEILLKSTKRAAPNESKNASPVKLSGSTQSVKSARNKVEYAEEKASPVEIEEYDDDNKYSRFPSVPDQTTPMLNTSSATARQTNIRTNPHFRNTQV